MWYNLHKIYPIRLIIKLIIRIYMWYCGNCLIQINETSISKISFICFSNDLLLWMNQILTRWDLKLYIFWVNLPSSLHHASYIPHSHPSQRAFHFISCTVLTFADIAVRPHFSARAVILGGWRTVRAGLERAVFGLVQVKDIADITEETRRRAVGAGVHARERERGGVKLKACISHSDACWCWHSKTIPAWKAKVWD